MAEHQGLDSDQRAARRRRQPDSAGTTPSGAYEAPRHPLLRLQSQVGNAQVARMLAQRASEDDDDVQREMAPEEDAGTVQRAAEDEEEAPVQRALDGAAAEVQREVGAAGGPLSAGTAAQVRALQGGGAPLDGPVRTQMEGAFGTSFEDVRVHTGGDAGRLNRSMGAKAFTIGSDVVLGQNANANDSRTLAHELTHVVQQRSMGGSAGDINVGAADDRHEQEADAVARDVTSHPSQTTDERD